MKGGPTCRVASRRRRNEMTSRDWQLTHQRLPYRAGIPAAPTPNPAGPRRRDDEPMISFRLLKYTKDRTPAVTAATGVAAVMKLRRRKPIACDRVDKNGASQAQSNEDHRPYVLAKRSTSTTSSWSTVSNAAERSSRLSNS